MSRVDIRVCLLSLIITVTSGVPPPWPQPPTSLWENYNSLQPQRCEAVPKRDNSGKTIFKVQCNQKLPKIRYENHLWLPGLGDSAQEVHIDVPNYSIEDVIKAAYKDDSALRTIVNLLLKKPEYLGAAVEYQGPKITSTAPIVNFGYEPVRAPQVVHWGGDQKPFSSLSSPLGPPPPPQFSPGSSPPYQHNPNQGIDIRSRAQRNIPILPFLLQQNQGSTSNKQYRRQ